jgi:hypothetical protein
MKNKASFLFMALMVLVLPRPVAATPYESFSLALDHLFGQDQWSAQSHESSGDGLTVKGLSAKLPLTEGSASTLTIESVFVKNLLSSDRMKALTTITKWGSKSDLVLAEALDIKGLRRTIAGPEGEMESLTLEEGNLAGLKLVKAAPEAPAGPAGFLRALRVGGVGYKNLRLALKSPEAEAVASLESGALEDLSFEGDLFPELAKVLDDKIDPDGLYKEMAGQSFKSLKVAGLKLDFKGLAPEARIQGGLSLAGLEKTDVQSFKRVGAFKLNDFQSRVTDGDGQVHTFNLNGLDLKSLDIAAYLDKIMAGLAKASDDPAAAEDIVMGQFTLADMFISAISLEEASLTGLDLGVPGLFTVKIAELGVTGPLRVGEIPASVKSRLKGLEISLSGDPQAEAGTPSRTLHELSQKMLGRKSWTLDFEADNAYDGQGLLTGRLSNLAVKDLFALSISSTFGGLTPARLEKFKTIPLAELQQAVMDPDELLGDVSFNALNLKYTDQGLIDFILELQARESGQTAASLKRTLLAQAGAILPAFGAQYVKDSESVSRIVMDFLKAPQSLEIDLKSAPPLTSAVFQRLAADPAALLDALNITLSGNGEAAPPLKFVPGLGG